MQQPPLRLRPHHLLCLQKFTGHGYDERFTAHMTAVVAALAANPATAVALTCGGDALCAQCPHYDGRLCNTLEKVALMDQTVLAACGLQYGQTAPWSALAANARQHIFETEQFSRVCSNCEWFDLCRHTNLP